MPFADLLDLDSKDRRRLWQSSPPFLESVGSIMSDNNEVCAARRMGAAAPARARSACMHAGLNPFCRCCSANGRISGRPHHA